MTRILVAQIAGTAVLALNACGGGGGSTSQNVATHFVVTAPGTAKIGSGFSFTVTALDSENNPATTYSGTVRFTSTDGRAVLPVSVGLPGSGMFGATLETAGPQTITATDVLNTTITGTSSSINVGGVPPTIHFSVIAPPAAAAGTAFNFTVTALDASNNLVGYSGTVHFTSTDGQAVLPSNSTLAIIGSRTFAATLNTAGTQTVTATDTVTASITGTSNSMNVNPLGVLTITSGLPPGGTVGATYGGYNPCPGGNPPDFRGFQFTASGGTAPYSWSAGGLPPGLTINGPFCAGTIATGAIGGTPTAPGSFQVSVAVTDSGSPKATARATYSIVISAAQTPAISTTPSPSAGAANKPYSFTFKATGGLPPHTWSQMGALPAGLAFDDRGVLSGKPKAAGSFPITVNVQDSDGRSAIPKEFEIHVFLHGFGATANMETARAWHTATLLNDGKLLVTGGLDTNGKPISAAELYDPATKDFSRTGSMGIARAEHTATLLKDGTVLVTGGIDATGNALTTAELYDPATGNFSRTSRMASARFHHTATLLKDGKVLVTGGSGDPGNKLLTAELFDPVTVTFSPTANMETARFHHTATLLSNGKVLLTGGTDANGNALATAELFDPATASFSPTSFMETARLHHTATLLSNGKVLLTGGTDANGNALATTELFDPATASFSPTGIMETARTGHVAVLLNDRTVLVTGGTDDNGNLLANAELFDFAEGTFTPTGSMQTARFAHTATLLTSGGVLVTGGGQSNGNVDTSAELYQ